MDVITDIMSNEEADTIGELQLWNTAVELNIRTADVEQCFLADPTLPATIVTANGQVVGVFSRKNFMAAISQPFGREVFIKRPLSELKKMMDTSPLVLPAETAIATALKAAMSRSHELCFEPLLVRYDNFFGLLEVNQLMTAQARLLEQTVRTKDDLIKKVERTAHELRKTLEEQERLAQELSYAKEVAQHEATHDSLTGLPNRKLFLQRLESALSAHREDPKQDCAVLFIDLDRFKIVNDSLGHLAGNELLKEVASRLNALVRKRNPGAVLEPETVSSGMSRSADMIARLSGDEFTVLLTENLGSGSANSFATRLHSALCKPFNLGSENVVISASIGIVSSLSGYDNTEAILRDADIAMYRAKGAGKAQAVSFIPSMRAQVETRLHIENRLRDAIVKQEFELHFQPIVATRNGGITGLEALIRWREPAGLIYPDTFIHIAEETGLIIPLGNWVFREACDTLRNLQSACYGHAPFNMSINLSAFQFGQAELPEMLEEFVRISEINPGRVTIEITERSAMADPEKALVTLKRLKSIGFLLAIDDFGTGYSSLSYLHRFPIDILKIDRSFISNLDSSADGGKIVGLVLALADSLGITVVAEGVETEHQLNILRELGCKFAQGYLFAKPMTKDKIAALLLKSASIPPRSDAELDQLVG